MSSLTAGLPWFSSWGSQIVSAFAQGQLAMVSDYLKMQVVRVLHKGVCRVFAAIPWAPENTIRTV